MRFPTARGVAALLLLALPAVAQAQSTPAPAKKSASEYSVQEFFRRAEYQQMSLSPNGQRLAATIPLNGRANLVVIDLDKRTRKVITAFTSLDVANFFWVNNDRLCLNMAESQDVSGNFNYKGRVCIDHNGDNINDFTKYGAGIQALATYPDGSADVVFAMAQRTRYSLDVYRFNTLNGQMTLLTSDSPGEVGRWVLDRNRVPRVAVSTPDKAPRDGRRKTTVWYRDGDAAKWEKISEYETLGSVPVGDYLSPIAFDYDNRTLYVSGRVNGSDKAAIYPYDTQAKRLGEVLFQHPLVDVTGGLVFSEAKKKLMGIRFEADKPVVRWLDEDMERLQVGMDKAFKEHDNTITFPRDNTERALLFTSSDVDPGSYYLYDRKRNGVEFVAKTRSWLDPKLMAERKFIQYTARDGRKIPAYVTYPRGVDPKYLPLIVNVHGGPWVRAYTWESWSRWPEAQFFASRGYVVLEPEPRASTGWGLDHWKAGWKQWGGAMQDDINDGALHLVKEGIVDRKRMCVSGGSYGGYASAMAAARDSDLWACANPFLAVTDLFLFKDVVYSDIAQLSDFFDTDFKTLVGDPSSDREMMTRSSPVRGASRVKIPVLLTMGAADVRVPEVHGDEFNKAVSRAGGKITYKVYPGEAHGYNKEENVVDFYTLVENFFAENTKPR